METLFKNLPAIIEMAAKSLLGLLALMIIALSILGFFFFRKASEKTRIGIFVLMFCGVVLFCFAALNLKSEESNNGIYLKREANSGEKIGAGMVEERGKAELAQEDIPLLEDVLGSCLVQSLPEGTRLRWDHIDFCQY